MADVESLEGVAYKSYWTSAEQGGVNGGNNVESDASVSGISGNQSSSPDRNQSKKIGKDNSIYDSLLIPNSGLVSLSKFRTNKISRTLFPDAVTWPSFFETNLVSSSRIIKLIEGQQAVIKGFYYQLLKLAFEIQNERDYLELFKKIIFSGKWQQPTESHPHTDIQYRRFVAEFIELLLGQSIPNFQMLIKQYPVVDEALTYCLQRVLEAKIKVPPGVKFSMTAQEILEVLSSVFEVKLVIYGNCYNFEDSDIFLYEEASTQFYLAFLSQMAEQSQASDASSVEVIQNTLGEQFPQLGDSKESAEEQAQYSELFKPTDQPQNQQQGNQRYRFENCLQLGSSEQYPVANQEAGMIISVQSALDSPSRSATRKYNSQINEYRMSDAFMLTCIAEKSHEFSQSAGRSAGSNTTSNFIEDDRQSGSNLLVPRSEKKSLHPKQKGHRSDRQVSLIVGITAINSQSSPYLSINEKPKQNNLENTYTIALNNVELFGTAQAEDTYQTEPFQSAKRNDSVVKSTGENYMLMSVGTDKESELGLEEKHHKENFLSQTQGRYSNPLHTATFDSHYSAQHSDVPSSDVVTDSNFSLVKAFSSTIPALHSSFNFAIDREPAINSSQNYDRGHPYSSSHSSYSKPFLQREPKRTDYSFIKATPFYRPISKQENYNGSSKVFSSSFQPMTSRTNPYASSTQAFSLASPNFYRQQSDRPIHDYVSPMGLNSKGAHYDTSHFTTAKTNNHDYSSTVPAFNSSLSFGSHGNHENYRSNYTPFNPTNFATHRQQIGPTYIPNIENSKHSNNYGGFEDTSFRNSQQDDDYQSKHAREAENSRISHGKKNNVEMDSIDAYGLDRQNKDHDLSPKSQVGLSPMSQTANTIIGKIAEIGGNINSPPVNYNHPANNQRSNVFNRYSNPPNNSYNTTTSYSNGIKNIPSIAVGQQNPIDGLLVNNQSSLTAIIDTNPQSYLKSHPQVSAKSIQSDNNDNKIGTNVNKINNMNSGHNNISQSGLPLNSHEVIQSPNVKADYYRLMGNNILSKSNMNCSMHEQDGSVVQPHDDDHQMTASVKRSANAALINSNNIHYNQINMAENDIAGNLGKGHSIQTVQVNSENNNNNNNYNNNKNNNNVVSNNNKISQNINSSNDNNIHVDKHPSTPPGFRASPFHSPRIITMKPSIPLSTSNFQNTYPPLSVVNQATNNQNIFKSNNANVTFYNRNDITNTIDMMPANKNTNKMTHVTQINVANNNNKSQYSNGSLYRQFTNTKVLEMMPSVIKNRIKAVKSKWRGKRLGIRAG